MEGGGFDWGWEALVAVGTIGLALGTFLLAWSTRRAARASSEDVRAQWRPAVVPGASAKLVYSSGERFARLEVRNVGRGAAYYLDAGLDVEGVVYPASPWKSEMAEPTNFAVLPVDEFVTLRFDGLDERPDECAVIVDYRDLNDRPYSTRILVNDSRAYELPGEPQVLVVSRVELGDDRELIPWKPPSGRLRYAIFRLQEWRRWRKQAKPGKNGEAEPF